MTGSGSWALWMYMTMAQVYKAIITGLCFTSVFICISNSAPNAKKVNLRLMSCPKHSHCAHTESRNFGLSYVKLALLAVPVVHCNRDMQSCFGGTQWL